MRDPVYWPCIYIFYAGSHIGSFNSFFAFKGLGDFQKPLKRGLNLEQ